MIPALELTYRGADDVVAYVCPRCGLIISPLVLGKVSNEVAERLASEHCDKRCRCGASIPSNRSVCTDCWMIDQAVRDLRKYGLAQKIYDYNPEDPVFWFGHEGSMGGGYFSNLDELRDFCQEEGVELPPYVWPCTPVELTIDTETILESVFQEHHEGARDMLASGAEEDLSRRLRDWCSYQGIRSWQPDFRRAIVLR